MRCAPRCVVLALLALLGTACGVRPSGVIGAGEPAVARREVPQTTVYLVRRGRLVPVRRVAFPDVPQATLYALWVPGMTREEEAQGLRNPIAGLGDFHVVFGDETLHVSFFHEPGMTDLIRAQIVCSGTAQPGVRRVRLYEEGTRILGPPMTCSRFARYMPG